jgi:hypothetical protein
VVKHAPINAGYYIAIASGNTGVEGGRGVAGDGPSCPSLDAPGPRNSECLNSSDLNRQHHALKKKKRGKGRSLLMFFLVVVWLHAHTRQSPRVLSSLFLSSPQPI